MRFNAPAPARRSNRVSVFIPRKPFSRFVSISVEARIRSVDTSTNIWHIGEVKPTPINFEALNPANEPLLDRLAHEIKHYIARDLPKRSPDSIKGRFHVIAKFLSCYDWQDADEGEFSDLLSDNLLHYIHANRSLTDESHLHELRSWYHRSYMMGLPDFDLETTKALSLFRFKGHLKGVDVLTYIPHRSPLTAQELDALKHALVDASDYITVGHRCFSALICMWLFISLGIRSRQMALLMRTDFIVNVDENSGLTTYLLCVPSVKKRYEIPRNRFQLREIPTFLGKMLEQHIHSTQRDNKSGMAEFPLFPIGSDEKRRKKNMVAEAYAFTANSSRFSLMLHELMSCLNNGRAHFNKKLLELKITPRRLRKTFATRAAALGIPMVELAQLLDHDDLQHVMVYYQLGLDFAEKLDRVLQDEFRDLLTFFKGEISLKELIDVTVPNVVFGPPRLRQLVGIGLCAKGTPCNLTPPTSCYVCPKFEACNDPGVHQEVLTAMQSDIKFQFGEDAPPGVMNAPHIQACKQLIDQLETNHD
jgi:integrase